MYATCVTFVQQVLAALGMAEALHEAGLWDEPPHESWANVMAAAESAAERAADQADAAQFDGQEQQAAAAAVAASAAEEAGVDEEAQEEAAAAAAAAAAEEQQARERPRAHEYGARSAR